MKSLVSIIIMGILLISCGLTKTESVQNSISGLYVKEIKQEFAVGMDSIYIVSLNKQASSYKVIRKSTYQQMVDGEVLSPKQEMHTWIAYYDITKNQLIEPNNERIFTFLPDKNILLMGSTQFRKVNASQNKKPK